MNKSKILELMELEAVLNEVMREILHLTERQTELEGLIKECKEEVYGIVTPVCETPEAQPAPEVDAPTPRKLTFIDRVKSVFLDHPGEGFTEIELKETYFPSRQHIPELSKLTKLGFLRNESPYYYLAEGPGMVHPSWVRSKSSPRIKNCNEGSLSHQMKAFMDEEGRAFTRKELVDVFPNYASGSFSPVLTKGVRKGIFNKDAKNRYYTVLRPKVETLLKQVRKTDTPPIAEEIAKELLVIIKYRNGIAVTDCKNYIKNLGYDQRFYSAASMIVMNTPGVTFREHRYYHNKHIQTHGTMKQAIAALLCEDFKGQITRLAKLKRILNVESINNMVFNELIAEQKIRRVGHGLYQSL